MNQNHKLSIQEKTKVIIKEMNQKLIEREKIVPIILLTLFSEQHMLLLGPPGVGKTYAIEMISFFAKELKYFEYLITNKTSLDELFGTSIVDKNNTMIYNIENSMLDSHICFIDELFKAPSTLLNSLLGVTHKSRSFFQRGIGKKRSPMISMFAASNELPESETVDAFDDRILFRFWVDEISDISNFKKFARRDFDMTKDFSVSITLDEFADVIMNSSGIFIHEDFVELYAVIRTKLATEKVRISDRKLQSSLDIFQTSALLNSRNYVGLSELFLLLDIAWKHYDDIERVKRVVFDIIFGNLSELQENVHNTKDNAKILISNVRSVNGNILKYKHNFFGSDAEEAFLLSKKELERIKMELDNVQESFKRIKDKYSFAKSMEKEIKDNIFIPDYKNHLFYDNSSKNNLIEKKVNISDIFKSSEDIGLILKNLNQWLKESVTLYEYNTYKIQKNI